MNQLRLLKLRILHPGFSACGQNFISENITVHCDHSSKIELINTYLAKGVFIEAKHGGHLRIQNSYVGPHSVIVTTKSITIDENCMIAEMVVIRDQNHTVQEGLAVVNSPLESAPIHIRKNVWLGAKATVLKGVTLGENSIVGAHALVNKSMPEKSLAIGLPAKNINNTTSSPSR